MNIELRERRMVKDRLLGTAILILAFMPYLITIPALETIHNRSLDLYQRVIPNQVQPDESHVVIVDMNAEFMATNGQWPVSRDIIANLIENIGRAGAKAIVLDIVFAELDKKGKPLLPDDNTKDISVTPIERKSLVDTDLMLARAISKWPVVLGVEPEFGKSEQIKSLNGNHSVLVINDYGFSWLAKVPRLYQNHELFSRHALGIGTMSLLGDANSKNNPIPISGVYAAMAYGSNGLSSLAAEGVRVYLGEKTYLVYGDWYGVFETSFHSIPRVKTGKNGDIWVHFADFGPDKYIPANMIANGMVDEKNIKDKIVFIGTSINELDPLRQIPTGKVVPGVEIHAQAAEAILSGGVLSNSITETIIEIFILVAVSLLAIIIIPIMNTGIALGVFVLMEIFTIWSGWTLFISQQRLVDVFYPAFILLVIVFLMLSVRKIFNHRV